MRFFRRSRVAPGLDLSYDQGDGLDYRLKGSAEQTALNLKRWAEVLADPELARLPHRIETDRHGHILMSPPPAPKHGNFQSEVAHLIRSLLSAGRVITECPLSTSDGVKP